MDMVNDIPDNENWHKTIQGKLSFRKISTANDDVEATDDVKDSVAPTINRFVSVSEIRQHWTMHIQITSKSLVNQNWKHDQEI